LGLGSIATQEANNVTITGGSISGITEIAVADGGTGASTESGARTNLGLVIGTNVQAWDADLDTYAANPLTAAELGQLQNIGATTITAAQWGYLGSTTAAGAALLDDVDAAAQRTTLGLGTIATEAAPSGTVVGTTDTQTLTNKSLTDPLIKHTYNAQTGTTYTLVAADQSAVITMSNASANTLTIPTNASVAFPIGTVILIYMLGAGTTTITGDTGVTVNGVSAGGADIQNQYGAATVVKYATDSWLISGDIGTVA